jgi:hypothetical protein
MATYYFDWDNGNDANAGTSEALPWKSYDAKFASTTTNDVLYFKRGTTQTVTTAFLGVRNGFRMYAYGVGPRPRWVASGAAASNGMILNFSRRENMVVEDQDFDATGCNRALYCAAQSTFVTNTVTFRRCLFHNAVVDAVSVNQEQTATAQPSQYTFDGCEFYDNGGHGLILMGTNHQVLNCKAYRNGATTTFGAHGFSARAARTEVSSGWTLVTGTTYSRTLAAAEVTVFGMYNFDVFGNMVQNTSTPTTPAAGEWGQSSTTLYVNSGANPNTQDIVYAWGPCTGIRYVNCEAYENIWNQAAPFQEGHGFAADDWTSNTQYVNCVSRDNDGLAFSFNRGSNNKLLGCIAMRNGSAGLTSIAGSNNVVYNCLFVDNNNGSAPRTWEIIFDQAASTSCVASNNILISSSGNTNGIRFDSVAGGTAATNAIYGYTTAVLNGTASGTITTDVRQWLNSDGSLRMPGNPLATAGTYVSGVTLANGRLRPGFVPIGAYMAVLPRTVRV